MLRTEAETPSIAPAASHDPGTDRLEAPATPLPYVDPANWSSGVTPSNAANEFLMINNGGPATVSGTQAAARPIGDSAADQQASTHEIVVIPMLADQRNARITECCGRLQ